jgi:gephyrin
MIPVEEALQTVLRVAKRLDPVVVPLSDALGHVLAENVLAPEPLPPFPASIKAGVSLSLSIALTL